MIKRVVPKYLREIDQFFSDIETRYFLIGGACLSIVRDGNLSGMAIPDNQDYDVYILKEDEPENFAEKLLDSGWTGRYGKKEIDYSKYKVGAYKEDAEISCELDINFLMKYDQFRWSILYRKYRLYSRKVFREPKRVEVEGVSVSVPNPPEEFLRQEYGKDWRIQTAMPWWVYPSIQAALNFNLHTKLTAIKQEYKDFSPTEYYIKV